MSPVMKDVLGRESSSHTHLLISKGLPSVIMSAPLWVVMSTWHQSFWHDAGPDCPPESEQLSHKWSSISLTVHTKKAVSSKERGLCHERLHVCKSESSQPEFNEGKHSQDKRDQSPNRFVLCHAGQAYHDLLIVLRIRLVRDLRMEVQLFLHSGQSEVARKRCVSKDGYD